jgi:NADH-quinone oxidoreductase subunit L
MFLAAGAGAYLAAVFHLMTHAFFKALLFLGSGSVIHAMHHAYHATHSHEDAQDMRNMGGLRQYMPVTFWLMMIATLAIAGIPPFAGFFSKDEILAAAFARGADTPLFYLFYGMGVLAALLTAFYMARLMAMTFLGPNRTGERERQHLHEAPWIMTGPLLVLGVLSAVGGALNLPHLVGGHAAMERWLEPVLEPGLRFTHLTMPSGSTEYFLVGAAVAIGAVGLWLGFKLTLGRPTPTAAAAPADTGLALVLNRKYYVDELYDALVVRPIAWLSRVVLWRGVDQQVIDGAAVNGTAFFSRLAGSGLRLLQTGQVGVYVVLFLVGAIWILRAVIR